jgi:hypothetical protein
MIQSVNCDTSGNKDMLQIFFTLLKQNFDKGPKLFIVLLLILDIWWY